MAKRQQAARVAESPEVSGQAVVMNLFRTSDRMQHRLARLFREYGLTSSQYNILRILRTEARAMPCLEIAQRTITVVPGITGLIDRLEAAKYVTRERDVEDRRVVKVTITQPGIDILGKIDGPLDDLHEKLLAEFSADEVAELHRLLEKARRSCEGESADEE